MALIELHRHIFSNLYFNEKNKIILFFYLHVNFRLEIKAFPTIEDWALSCSTSSSTTWMKS